LARPGVNRVKIIVTNTMENARAVENHARKLERIDVNGLLGPVTITPYLEAELKCVLK
jgi:phosphoribosylpyrophosphate synthetase